MAFSGIPLVETVLHPSDFSEASDNAFAHALAIALRRETRLTMLHAGPGHPTLETWESFPGVRDTLVRWGLLEGGAPRSAVLDELNVRIDKIAVRASDRVRAIVEFLEDHPAELIVLATEGRAGLAQWLQPSVAERTARRSETMTLFVPTGARGFVSLEDGTARLKNILLPVDRKPPPEGALELAARAAEAFGEGDVEIHLLHVGDRALRLDVREGSGWTWSTLAKKGEPVDVIVQTAERVNADLVVMATAGREGFLDALRGSTTEQVLRRTSCPLLAVPTR
ncbi:MAG: universal stress protein [Acidobacteriota bacterium]|nr:MAG: universal stress protein [Acidobacteriota bacterium]